MKNIVHLIINNNLIPIHCIINHNLLNITNFNIIVRIEEHSKFFPKKIMKETKWENMSIFVVEYLDPTFLPITSLGNNSYERKNNPTDYYLTSLITETSRMHKKSHCHIFNKKRGNHLLHLLASNQVLSQQKLIIVLKFIQKQKKYILKNMSVSEKYISLIIQRNKY